MQQKQLVSLHKVIEMLVIIACCAFFFGAQYSSKMFLRSSRNPGDILPPREPQDDASESLAALENLVEAARRHIVSEDNENGEPQVVELDENDQPIPQEKPVVQSELARFFEDIFMPFELKSFVLKQLNFKGLATCRLVSKEFCQMATSLSLPLIKRFKHIRFFALATLRLYFEGPVCIEDIYWMLFHTDVALIYYARDNGIINPATGEAFQDPKDAVLMSYIAKAYKICEINNFTEGEEALEAVTGITKEDVADIEVSPIQIPALIEHMLPVLLFSSPMQIKAAFDEFASREIFYSFEMFQALQELLTMYSAEDVFKKAEHIAPLSTGFSSFNPDFVNGLRFSIRSAFLLRCDVTFASLVSLLMSKYNISRVKLFKVFICDSGSRLMMPQIYKFLDALDPPADHSEVTEMITIFHSNPSDQSVIEDLRKKELELRSCVIS